MIEEEKRIGDLLQQLADSVSRDGKADTALHLRSLRQRIIESVDAGGALVEIAQLAPLAQYANFSNQQERLLGLIQELAETLRQTT